MMRFEKTTKTGARARNRRAMLTTALGAMALLLGTATAHSADACYQDSIGDIMVFKSFRMPRAGDCKPLTGHQHNSWATLAGTICGTSEGSAVVLNFTYMTNAYTFGTAHYSLSRTSGNGSGQGCDGRVDGGAWGCSDLGVYKVDCPRPTRFP
jgi:hypothetical protein